MKALLFSGTSDGRELAMRLAEAGVETCVSVASDIGAKTMPEQVANLSVIVGAIPAEEKPKLFSEYDVIVDATHPFAESISAHVAQAASDAQKPLLRVVREPSDLEGCLTVPDLQSALELIDDDDVVLSTTGVKQIAEYAELSSFAQRVYARVLDDDKSIQACLDAGLELDHIIAKCGPFSIEDNIADIDRFEITALVTKDSGAAGGLPEKVEACRKESIKCIVITRPVEHGLLVSEAFEKIMEMKGI